jgi:hypothetical protein
VIYSRVRLAPEAKAGLDRRPARVAAAGINLIREQLIKHPEAIGVLAERGVEVDHVTVHRWVQRFTPLLADAAHFRPPLAG